MKNKTLLQLAIGAGIIAGLCNMVSNGNTSASAATAAPTVEDITLPFTGVTCTKVYTDDKQRSVVADKITVTAEEGMISAEFGDYFFMGLVDTSGHTKIDDKDPDVYSAHVEGNTQFMNGAAKPGAYITVFKSKTPAGKKTEGDAVYLTLANGQSVHSSHCTWSN